MSAPSSPCDLRPKFRVAICGAGVGGLVLAITIGKYDPSIPIDLYEAHDTIDCAGVGINVGKKTHEALTELGLFDDFTQIFNRKPGTGGGPKIRRADIREGGYPWFNLTKIHATAMHRQQMIAILERSLPASCTVHSRKRLVNYVEPEDDVHSTSPITLEFTDGTTATTDILIGADGIRSAVRKSMFQAASRENGNGDLKQYIDASFTGISVYRYLIPTETLKEENPENASLKWMTTYTGKGRYLVTYPIVKGTVINVAAMICDPGLTGTHYEGRWVSDAARDEVVDNFDHFEPDAREVIKFCEKPSKWALHVVKPLPFCVRKRVALIGDACHAMTPHLGAGAGQAIDDAFVLGRLIAHPLAPLSRVHEAFRIYEEIRYPTARTIASLSLSTAWMFTFLAPGYYDGTRDEADPDEGGIGSHERAGLEMTKQGILKGWDWMNEAWGPLRAWEEGETKLQGLAGQVSN